MFKMAFETKATAYCLEHLPTGKLVSFCGYYRLSDEANLIICYITDKDHRRMGYGKKCFQGKTFHLAILVSFYMTHINRAYDKVNIICQFEKSIFSSGYG